MRNTMTRIADGALLAGSAAVLSLALATPAAAQSLASRVQAAGPSATVSFAYQTRPGVCGDGNSIITRGDGDDFSITHMNDNGRSFNMSSTKTAEGRAALLRNCVEGPARVELKAQGGTFATMEVTVGGSGSASLGTVTPQEAVAYLLALAETAPHKVGSKALFAATLANAGADATTGLIALSRKQGVNRDVRKDAVFWIGQSDDPRAMPRLKEILNDTREHMEVRKSAIFAISLQDGDASIQTLIGTAKNANVQDLRKDAIFWLGQKAADRATEGLESVLGDDSEEMEVREAALFALSQQKSDHAFDALMNVAKSSKEPELRRTALFWLGQRGDDPRVLALFENILLTRK